MNLKNMAFLVCIACFLGAAQVAVANDDPAPRILVTGEGSAEVAPDMAVLNLSVLREAPTAREALSANSAAMAKVLEAMTALGIAERDLQTSNFDIQPRYTHPARPVSGILEAPKLVGYAVRNALSVRVRDISKVGEVLDKSVSLGVNEGGSILFTNDDPSAVVSEARVRAVKQALAKARTLADAAGVEVGRVLEISEQSYNPRPMAMAKFEMVASSVADSVPIAAGENSYKVTVSVSLAIEQ